MMKIRDKSNQEYLPNAPPALINLFSKRNNFPGKEILERLLTNSEMEYAWEILSEHITDDKSWGKLWQEIIYICYASRRELSGKSRKLEGTQKNY